MKEVYLIEVKDNELEWCPHMIFENEKKAQEYLSKINGLYDEVCISVFDLN